MALSVPTQEMVTPHTQENDTVPVGYLERRPLCIGQSPLLPLCYTQLAFYLPGPGATRVCTPGISARSFPPLHQPWQLTGVFGSCVSEREKNQTQT